jgi:hypothetical protein
MPPTLAVVSCGVRGEDFGGEPRESAMKEDDTVRRL